MAQLTQPIGSENRATGAGRDYKVWLENIGPFDRQRAQPSVRARIGDAVSTPIVAYGQQIERLPSQRMERVRDRKNLRAVLVTVCNARQTPNRPRKMP
jgi:hypothetical protein